jgi:hypothetical protein
LSRHFRSKGLINIRLEGKSPHPILEGSLCFQTKNYLRKKEVPVKDTVSQFKNVLAQILFFYNKEKRYVYHIVSKVSVFLDGRFILGQWTLDLSLKVPRRLTKWQKKVQFLQSDYSGR